MERHHIREWPILDFAALNPDGEIATYLPGYRARPKWMDLAREKLRRYVSQA
jgi:hypothetical protein